jgi:hypothetical protein
MFLSICSKALLPCAFHFEILVVDTPFYSTNGSPWPCMGSQRKQLTARSSTPHTEQHARIHTAAPAHSPRDQRSIDLPLTAHNTARSGDGAPTHEHQHPGDSQTLHTRHIPCTLATCQKLEKLVPLHKSLHNLGGSPTLRLRGFPREIQHTTPRTARARRGGARARCAEAPMRGAEASEPRDR